jgi:biotin transport system substrate-specific component
MPNNKTKKMILISLFAALTAIGAYIKIPGPPVPFTLQIFFVLLAGLLLGSKAGFASQALYILIGLAGIPVFTEGGGISYIFKPQFGYLIGFAAMTYIVGLINETFFRDKKHLLKYIAASFVGLLVCYAIGIGYMYLILKYVTHQSSSLQIVKLISNVFLIFLPWDTLKIISASWLAKEVSNRLAFLEIRKF